MRGPRLWKPLCALAVAVLSLSCLDKLPTDTGSAPLYAFDETSHAVLAWADVSALYDAGAAGTADRTISSSARIGSSFTLGLGGMTLDASRQYLYLVAATGGKVVRITRIGAQSGDLSSTSDIISFTIDDSGTDAESGSPVFGQAAVDSSSNNLYVTENNGSNSQIWVIPLGAIADGATVGTSTSDTVQATLIGNTKLSGGTQDSGCTGVATNSAGQSFAYFGSGNTIYPGGNSANTPSFQAGDRLRKGTSSGFDPWKNIILGQSDSATTRLSPFGSLAYDTSGDYLYAACQNGTATPLVAFSTGQFDASGPVETAPALAFGGPADLRVIAHAGQKDWVVGTDQAGTTLWIWKGPSTGTDAHLSMPLSGIQIAGLALDGSN
jgi:hypothetical protein